MHKQKLTDYLLICHEDLQTQISAIHREAELQGSYAIARETDRKFSLAPLLIADAHVLSALTMVSTCETYRV